MEFEWFIEPVVSIMVIALVVTLTMIGITREIHERPIKAAAISCVANRQQMVRTFELVAE
jgi:hypothetical protein